MTPHTLITAVLVLLAAGTGLMWPKSNIQAEGGVQEVDEILYPTPIRTLSYRSPMQALEEPPAYPAWTVRADGLWVPWTLQPPAWWTAIAGSYVVAETVPLPPERPKDKTAPTPKTGDVLSLPEPRARRIATPDGGLCAKHGLRQVWTDRYRWRCRP